MALFGSGYAAGAGRGAEAGHGGWPGAVGASPAEARSIAPLPVGGPVSEFSERYEAMRAGEARAADSAGRVGASIPRGVPLRGGRLTSTYTPRRYHPILRRVRPHWGIDIAAPPGTPVLAAGDGIIVGVARSSSYGRVIDVSHGSGKYITRYAHLSAVLVRPGQAVVEGQMIGRVGSTGLSSGPHLHYEVYIDGRSRDPGLFLAAGESAGLLP